MEDFLKRVNKRRAPPGRIKQAVRLVGRGKCGTQSPTDHDITLGIRGEDSNYFLKYRPEGRSPGNQLQTKATGVFLPPITLLWNNVKPYHNLT